MESLYPLLLVLNLLWTLGLSVMTYARKPGEEAARAAALAEQRLGELIADHSRRIGSIETHMEHMPTSEELVKLEGLVQTMVERTNGMNEVLSGMRASVGRIETWILNNKG